MRILAAVYGLSRSFGVLVRRGRTGRPLRAFRGVNLICKTGRYAESRSAVALFV